MEKIPKNLGKKFPDKDILQINYPKSNMRNRINKFPIHVLKNIFEFLEFTSDQVEYSKLSKKFKKIFELCCEEKEDLMINSSIKENIIYFIFSKFILFKSIKKFYLYNLTLDKNLLNHFYQINLKNLIKLKLRETTIIDDDIENMEKEFFNFSQFISKFNNYEVIEFSGFFGRTLKKGISNDFYTINFDVCFPNQLKNLRKLVISNCTLSDISFEDFHNTGEINLFKKFPNLEIVDFSKNDLQFNFLIGPKYISFGESEKIRKILLRGNKINFRYFSNISLIHDTPFSDIIFSNYELLDMSDNFNTNSNENVNDDFKKKFPNLILLSENMKKRKIVIMRMVFSRSGILNTHKEKFKYQFYVNSYNQNIHRRIANSVSNNKENQEKESNDFVFNKSNKFLGKKENDSILPCLIYDSPSKINLDRHTLIKILQFENDIRLSDFAKTTYDENKNKGKDFHLNLDLSFIKKALIKYGFNPDFDDSIKAYHLATKNYISDPDVVNSVVWMKFDKCKIGKYSIGDKPQFNNIKIVDLNRNEILLKNFVSQNKNTFNLIISGSLS